MALQPLAGGDPAQVAGYRLRARLGAGGMGVVYLAYTGLGRPVAVKVVRPELGNDPAFRERFRQEVAAAWRVSGLFTAQVLDADPDAALPWLVTAYVPGPSLAEAVAVRGPLPELTVLWLVRGVSEALAAIHGVGVLHRDLKPSHVLLAPDGPRVIDFGIAPAVGGTALAQKGVRAGSPQFMAPEQAGGEPTLPAADVWALGATGCFAATGRAPFPEGGGEQAVLYRVLHEQPDLGGCPPEVAAVLTACLARDPGARPSPSQVSEVCRAAESRSAAKAGGSWLPPALAADLSEYAPPAPNWPASAFSPNSADGPAPALGPGPVPAPGPAPVFGPGPVPVAAPGPVPVFGPAPAPGPAAIPGRATIPATAWGVPSGQGLAGAPTSPTACDPPRRGWRRLSGRALAACVAAVVVLISAAAYGAVALTSHAGRTPAANGTVNGRARNVARPTGGPSSPAPGSPTPSPTSTLDSCLFGTWKQTLEQIPDTINGNPVTLSGGSGVIQTFLRDGVSTVEYGKGGTYTVRVNGNLWSEVVTGSGTENYATQDGMLLVTDVIAHGTQALYENGSYNNGGPLTLSTQPERYTCSAASLVEFELNGGSVDLTRQ
jgi:protein kinase-like protein